MGMKKEIKTNSKTILNDHKKIITEIVIDSVDRLMRVRCLYEGCRYGIKGVDIEPLDHCIWCGAKRSKEIHNFTGMSVADLTNEVKQNEDENKS